MTENVGGRFLVITGQPQVYPGACLVCKGIEGPFIDTLQGDDYLGGFFFCINCVREMSTVLKITVDNNPLEQHNAYVRGARDTINGVERHLRDYFDNLDLSSVVADVPDLVSNGVPDSLDGEEPKEIESGEESGRISASGSTLEVDRSPFDEGPASVSSGTGDGPRKKSGAGK